MTMSDEPDSASASSEPSSTGATEAPVPRPPIGAAPLLLVQTVPPTDDAGPATVDEAQAPPEPQPDPAEPPALSYPGAPESLIDLWMVRRRRMSFGPGEGLPPLDADLKHLLQTPIPDPGPAPRGKMSLHGQKLHGIRAELVGKPELAALNAILIAHLRKTGYPRHAPALFHRIWAEEGTGLLPHLPGRWLISTIITFGDHGLTEAQRRIGLAVNVFFSLMKLYEYERIHSGFAPDRPFPIRRTRGKELPVGMPGFALVGGGLDINLLAQIWQEARNEPIVGPLACALFDRLNADPGNLFRRIGLMRSAKRARRASRTVPPPAPAADN
jgi:hypothetical protein